MIALASDHAGYALRVEIRNMLDEKGLAYKDFGIAKPESTDYPVWGYIAARAVASGECEKGLLFCGTGIGISLAANKVHGIRCAVCSDCYSAMMSRKHNNANMLALGSRVVGTDLARLIVSTWLETEFEGGRHARRVDEIMQIEAGKGEEVAALAQGR
jgi:ribose 5-phosphate isomerase B